jgi:ArsR family transcriptional regulator
MSNTRSAVDTVAAMFKALSSPQRLRMFQRLVRGCCGTPGRRADPASFCCAGELGSDLKLAPSTVSHHLKELRQSGLVRVERRGQRINCWVSEAALAQLGGFLDGCRGLQPPRDARVRRRPAPEGASQS